MGGEPVAIPAHGTDAIVLGKAERIMDRTIKTRMIERRWENLAMATPRTYIY
jgi:hypothetical protein